MAPKVMKRPASVSTVGREAKRSATESWHLSAAKHRAIADAIKDVEGVPTCVHDLLLQLRGRAQSIQGHEKAVRALGEILDGIDNTLQDIVIQFQAKLDGVDQDKQQRLEAHANAESKIADLKQTVAEKKSAHDRAAADIGVAQQGVKDGKVGKKRAGSEVRVFMKKKDQLEDAQQSFAPLKDMQAKGVQLKALRTVGKQFGFHRVLLDAVPAVLRKQPDRRQTFDKLTMQQLENEFTKHVGKMEAAVQESEVSVEKNVAVMQAAENFLREAKKIEQTSAKEVAEAEEALKESIDTLKASKQHLKKFPRDTAKARHDLERAKERLSAFRAGPHAVFQQLLFQAQSEQAIVVQIGTVGEDAASVAANATWSAAEGQIGVVSAPPAVDTTIEPEAWKTPAKLLPASEVCAEEQLTIEATAVDTAMAMKACNVPQELHPTLEVSAEEPMKLEATATASETTATASDATADLSLGAGLRLETHRSLDCGADKNDLDRMPTINF